MRHFFIFILFLSCINLSDKSDSKENTIKKYRYYENGNIKEEITCIIEDKDTLFHGEAKEFYPNGKVKIISSYLNGKIHGNTKNYYENGLLKTNGWIKNDNLDSIFYTYFNIGNTQSNRIKTIEFFKEGHRMSHQLKYFENGEVESYFFFYPSDVKKFQRDYNIDGSILNEAGLKSPIITLHAKNDKDKFYMGDTLRVSVYAIYPPKTERKIFIKVGGFQNEWKEYVEDNYYYPIYYELPLFKSGKYTFEAKMVLKDRNNNAVTEHLNKFDFAVK